jgi:hypothetical protein
MQFYWHGGNAVIPILTSADELLAPRVIYQPPSSRQNLLDIFITEKSC